jgi:phospholipid/cholesterol/gamma-HCH transport system permease protein
MPNDTTAEAGRCELTTSDAGTALKLAGAWRLATLPAAWRDLRALKPAAPLVLDGSALESLDAAAALALLRAVSAAGIDPRAVTLNGFSEAHRRIFEDVRRRLAATEAIVGRAKRRWLAELGEKVIDLGVLLAGHLNFLGESVAAFGDLLLKPARLRVRELTSQLEQVCLNAVPVVALVTLLIGVTIAYLLGLQAEKYGANIFVVDGVAIGMTREFAPIIVATIIAGRSGAAFTAQLGAMRLTEEIDAIRTLGLSPQQVLVVPRVLALMLALPLLVFVGDIMGIVGAMLVAEPMLGLTPTTFLERLHEALDIKHVWVGLGKAPAFALFIAIIGCRMGMTVERDTRAVGLATTSTVVQSIVAVILLDAGFAVLFQELGW